MVVRFVSLIRVPARARPCVPCVPCVPAPPGVFLPVHGKLSFFHDSKAHHPAMSSAYCLPTTAGMSTNHRGVVVRAVDASLIRVATLARCLQVTPMGHQSPILMRTHLLASAAKREHRLWRRAEPPAAQSVFLFFDAWRLATMRARNAHTTPVTRPASSASRNHLLASAAKRAHRLRRRAEPPAQSARPALEEGDAFVLNTMRCARSVIKAYTANGLDASRSMPPPTYSRPSELLSSFAHASPARPSQLPSLQLAHPICVESWSPPNLAVVDSMDDDGGCSCSGSSTASFEANRPSGSTASVTAALERWRRATWRGLLEDMRRVSAEERRTANAVRSCFVLWRTRNSARAETTRRIACAQLRKFQSLFVCWLTSSRAASRIRRVTGDCGWRVHARTLTRAFDIWRGRCSVSVHANGVPPSPEPRVRLQQIRSDIRLLLVK